MLDVVEREDAPATRYTTPDSPEKKRALGAVLGRADRHHAVDHQSVVHVDPERRALRLVGAVGERAAGSAPSSPTALQKRANSADERSVS